MAFSSDITIIGIFGRNNELGEGKTILLTHRALKEHREFPNRSIYADYKLPFTKPINHISEFPNISESPNLVSVYIRDAIEFFDSRESGININETHILTELRHYGINLCYDAQLKGAIDGRLRRISNMIIETEQIKFPLFHLWFYSKSMVLLDDFNIEYGNDVISIYNTLEKFKREISLDLLNDLFSKYNTKVSFRVITKAKFNFKNNMSDTVFICLEKDDIDSIKNVLIPYGYELVS